MPILSVSELTRHIKDLLEEDERLQDLWIQGEVSGFRLYPSGHAYFTLKDEAASIRCVLWRSDANRQRTLPQDGQAVIIHGRVSIYEPRGAYQLYVDLIQPVGIGSLYLRLEELKERLQAEGLFAPERKRPLPQFPRRLGVVTSPQAAAWKDILRVLRQRYPLVEVILAPAQVQGEGAPEQIADAIQALSEDTDVEVIIVARGGGSLEELWAFNEEMVARAIYHARVPVVSGVGHEIDFTIADWVADVRAPTPTAAAALVVPDAAELRSSLQRSAARLGETMRDRMSESRADVDDLALRLRRASPQAPIVQQRQRLDEWVYRTHRALRQRLAVQRERLRSRELQLASLDPQATLERGYSITTQQATGEVIRSVSQVATGDRIAVQLAEGRLRGVVEEPPEEVKRKKAPTSAAKAREG
ncbi:MAG: exodeoxyribonuclease VII large subunit [Chloroflexi bacterium]|nr:exodeoxyribonuclease VII large subunit [Chloroflexota bacterium]